LKSTLIEKRLKVLNQMIKGFKYRLFYAEEWLALKRAVWSVVSSRCLAAEAVQSATLAFEGIDHVHRCHGLPLRVLGVSDGVSDHVLEEYFEDTSGLFVDQTRYTFDTSSSGQTSDRGLCDTLDVVSQDLSVTFRASLSETFTSFASSGHRF